MAVLGEVPLYGLICLGALIWTWLGYPVWIATLAFVRLRNAPCAESRSPETAPGSVSVILAVHNGESKLRERIQNLRECLADVPWAEIVVGLDGCTDGSSKILEALSDGPIPVRVAEGSRREGKSVAQNRAVAVARGGILLLSDLDTRTDPGGVNALLKPFQDPSVGFVAGNLGWRSEGEHGLAHVARSYTGFERWLWRQESAAGVLHVAPGAFMAMRRELFRPLDPDVGDDAKLPLDVLACGYRGAFAPAAHASDRYTTNYKEEFWSRARMTSRGMRATMRGIARGRLWRRPALLISIVSHRLLRWTTPAWFLGLVVAIAPMLGGLILASFLRPWGVAIWTAAAAVLLGTRQGRRLPARAFAWGVAAGGLLYGVGHYLARGSIQEYGRGRQ